MEEEAGLMEEEAGLIDEEEELIEEKQEWGQLLLGTIIFRLGEILLIDYEVY